MAMIDLLIDFFFFPSSSLPCDVAEVREVVEAEEPFRRRLKPVFSEDSVPSTEFRLLRLWEVLSAMEGVPNEFKDSCDRANADASSRRCGPEEDAFSEFPFTFNFVLGVLIFRLDSIFMGVPASPFLGFLVGVGPADEVEGAFSILAKSSTFFRFCKAFEGGLGRAGTPGRGGSWLGRGLS